MIATRAFFPVIKPPKQRYRRDHCRRSAGRRVIVRAREDPVNVCWTPQDLVRAREDVPGDLMSARHRLSKLLLRQGIVCSEGVAWTGKHDRWVRRTRRS